MPYERPQEYPWYTYSTLTLQAADYQPWKLLHTAPTLPTCHICGQACSRLQSIPLEVIGQAVGLPDTDPDIAPKQWRNAMDVYGKADVCPQCREDLELYKCDECREWIGRAEYTKVNANTYLHDTCLEDTDWRQCADCNEWVDTAVDAYTNPDDDYICSHCAENYTICYDCERRIRRDDAIDLPDGNEICYRCRDRNYTTCHDCNDVVRDSDAVEYNGDGYCQDCYDGLDIHPCESCGERYPESGMQRYDGNWYCPSCHDGLDISGPASTLHDYDFKPKPNFLGSQDPTALYMGVELEIQSPNQRETLNKIGECKDQDELYNKYDGSLADGKGIEMVSHPATLAYHQEKFGWEKLITTVQTTGADSHDNGRCGLHVHISRKALSAMDGCKVGVFIYTHFREDGGNVNKLARRGPGHYCQVSQCRKNACEQGAPQRDHYDAVNYKNDHTIEIRCARGTLRYASFIAWLEFVAAIVAWVPSVSMAIVADEDKSWQNFTAYVQGNADKYSHLISYMREKGV